MPKVVKERKLKQLDPFPDKSVELQEVLHFCTVCIHIEHAHQHLNYMYIYKYNLQLAIQWKTNKK